MSELKITFENFTKCKENFGEKLGKLVESEKVNNLKIKCDLDYLIASLHVIDDTNDAIRSFIESEGFSDNDRGLSRHNEKNGMLKT